MHPQIIIRAFRKATSLSVDKIKELSVKIEKDDKVKQRELLIKCAATALNSKLVAGQKQFFANMVVEAVSLLDDLLPLNMIGVKKIQGGALEVKLFINFTVFKVMVV